MLSRDAQLRPNGRLRDAKASAEIRGSAAVAAIRADHRTDLAAAAIQADHRTDLAAAGIMVAAGIMMAVKNRHTDLVEIRSVAAADHLSRADAEHPAILSGFAAISRLHM